MNELYIDYFFKSAQNTLSQFGICDIEKETFCVKNELIIENDVIAFIGIVGSIKGNIAYSFSNKTALSIASLMVMGMAVESLDDMSRSAIAELANILTGSAVCLLSNEATTIDITPPSVLDGKDIFLVLSTIKSFSISLKTSVGNIDISIAIEV